MIFKKLSAPLAAFAAFFIACAPALSQWQVPDHTVPVGRGSGVTGFKNSGTGAAGYPLTGNGVSADPTFQGFTADGSGAVTRTPQNKSREILSVLDFGAVADGDGAGSGTDNCTAFQTALTAASSTSNKILIVPRTNALWYKTTCALSIPAGVSVVGRGNPLIDGTTVVFSSNSGVFYSSGTIEATGHSVTTNIGAGDSSINVNTHGLAADDFFLLQSTLNSLSSAAGAYRLGPGQNPTSSPFTEILQVDAVTDANNVTTTTPVTYPFATADSSAVWKLTLLGNVAVKGLYIRTGQANAILMRLVQKCVVEDNITENTAVAYSTTVILFVGTYGCTSRGNKGTDLTKGIDAKLTFAQGPNKYLLIDQDTAINGRHAIDFGVIDTTWGDITTTAKKAGPNLFSRVTNCRAIGQTGGSLRMHEGNQYISWDNCEAVASYGVGTGSTAFLDNGNPDLSLTNSTLQSANDAAVRISDWSKRSILSGNKLSQIGSASVVETVSVGDAVGFDTNANPSLSIVNNTIVSNTSIDAIGIRSRQVPVANSGLLIANNIFLGGTARTAISLSGNGSEFAIARDNLIIGGTYSDTGIRVGATGVTLAENSFYNLGALIAPITITATNPVMTGNKYSGTNGTNTIPATVKYPEGYATAGTILGTGVGTSVLPTATPILGVAGTTIGTLALSGNTSGTATITPQAAAGSPVITLGTSSGTPAVTASSPLAINSATGNIACATCVTTSGGGGGAAGTVLQGSTGYTATPTLGVAGATIGTLGLAGNTSGTATITPQAAAGSPVVTIGTNSGTAVVTASSPLAINTTTGNIGCSTCGVTGSSVSQFTGVTDGSNASAGQVGEVISATVASGSAVGLTTGNAANVTSINLTAGDWTIYGQVAFAIGTTTSITALDAGISQTNATLPGAGDLANPYDNFRSAAFVPGTTTIMLHPSGGRISLSGPATVYLVARASFTISTVSAYGFIWARRER